MALIGHNLESVTSFIDSFGKKLEIAIIINKTSNTWSNQLILQKIEKKIHPYMSHRLTQK